MNDADIIRQLREENAKLLDRVAALEGASVRGRVLQTWKLQITLGLSPLCAKLVARLWRGYVAGVPAVSLDQLLAALYGAEEPASGVITLRHCVLRTRKAIGKDTIASIYGAYRLTDTGVAIIKPILDPTAERRQA